MATAQQVLQELTRLVPHGWQALQAWGLERDLLNQRAEPTGTRGAADPLPLSDGESSR